MIYIIVPEPHSDLQVDVDSIADELRNNWSSVEFEDVDKVNDPAILRWSFEMDYDRQLGALHKDRRTISIDDFPGGVAKFAVWYRKIVPARYKLFLSDDSSAKEIELTETITEQELLGALSDA